MDLHALNDLKEGSLLLIGHEANGVTARKNAEGEWLYTHNNRPVSYDDLEKNGLLIYAPEVTHLIA